MNYNMNNTQTAINTDKTKKWYIQKFESIFGDFPEVEIQNETEIRSLKKTSLLKNHKILRYSIFPVVLVLIILDEIYIRLKDTLKKIDESD